MNVTELARRLRINTKELLDILPEYGFDIGKKAIKIDDKVAQQVMRKWRFIKRDIEEKKRKELEEKRAKERALRQKQGQKISLPNFITVRNFAERLGLPTSQILVELMKNGILANQNQDIDFDTASIIAEDLGFKVEKESKNSETTEAEKVEILEKALKQSKDLKPRAPVVVVMGHVDHGKTKLLDAIRETNVVAKEAGGITQHIGAYQTVWIDPKTKEKREITFIDTPGHEAFTMMRSRGAKVADIGILIVAADDGVKPQTKEAIEIIKAAKLPYIVAINKIDKETADPIKTKTELSQNGVIVEEWGGDIPAVEISAKQKINIDKLLDVLLLTADLHADEIVADSNLKAVGTIIESHVDKSMGPVATVLIQAGTLHIGDKLVVNGEIYGKVRAMKDYKGQNIKIAGPSVPAQIIGFKVAPEVGDIMDVNQEKTAKEIDVRQKKSQQTGAEHSTLLNNDLEADEHEKKTLNLLIKADVLGSLEAIIASLAKIKHDEVGIKIVGKGLGNVNEDDVIKAEAGKAIIVGFNVNVNPIAEENMREKGIEFKKYSIIYDLINWIRETLQGMLSKETIITELGLGKVLAVFRKDKGAMTIGCRITKGKVVKNCLVRIKRDNVLMGTGKIVQCKIGKADVNEVNEGTECGLRYEGKERLIDGDRLEFYTEQLKARQIEF